VITEKDPTIVDHGTDWLHSEDIGSEG